jgi:hypothetical protein
LPQAITPIRPLLPINLSQIQAAILQVIADILKIVVFLILCEILPRARSKLKYDYINFLDILGQIVVLSYKSSQTVLRCDEVNTRFFPDSYSFFAQAEVSSEAFCTRAYGLYKGVPTMKIIEISSKI